MSHSAIMSSCYLSGKTRSTRDCSGYTTLVDNKIMRCVPGITPDSRVCRKHWLKIQRENSRRCSCPAPWQHTQLSDRPIPMRLYQVFDEVGKTQKGYEPGTAWCHTCKTKCDFEFFPTFLTYCPPSKQKSSVHRERSPLVSFHVHC